MYKLCSIMHLFLCISCFMNQSPSFSNGVLLQCANFFGLGLQIFIISKMAIELFESQPISWMAEPDQVIGSIWLKVEITTFFAISALGASSCS